MAQSSERAKESLKATQRPAWVIAPMDRTGIAAPSSSSEAVAAQRTSEMCVRYFFQADLECRWIGCQYSGSMQMPSSPTSPSWPAFANIEVRQGPQGFMFVPRGGTSTYWIEAIVWLVAFALLGCMLAFGGMVLQVVGGLGIFSVGIRAVLRTVRVLATPSLRTLRLNLRVPRPALAGPFEHVALAELARLTVTSRAGDVYLRAETSTGLERWLVALAPQHTRDYEALAAALYAFVRGGGEHSRL